MKNMKNIIAGAFCALLMAVPTMAQTTVSLTTRIIVLLPKLSAVTGEEAEWLPGVVKDKLEANIGQYMNFAVVDSSNVAELKQLQSQSENDSYDEATVIEIGKMMNANYAFFPTVIKTGKRYMLSVGCTNIKTGLRSASAMSKGRSTVEGLFDDQGCAVDEVTLDLCEQLKVHLTDKQIASLKSVQTVTPGANAGTTTAQSTASGQSAAQNAAPAAPKKSAEEIRADVKRRIAAQNSKKHKVYDKASDFTYRINDDMDGVIITDIINHNLPSGVETYGIIIPDEIEGMPVVGVESCHRWIRNRIKSIVFSDYITELPYDLFSGCSMLEEVVLPAYITKIGQWMFRDCTSLKSIVLPDAVTEIDDGELDLNTYTRSDEGAFTGCTSLESVTLPQSLTKIGSYAFWGCNALKSITLPPSLKEIGNSAFMSCSLETVTLPPSIKSIGGGAFRWCSSLNEVNMAEGAKMQFGGNIFEGCYRLTMKTKIALKKAGYDGF